MALALDYMGLGWPHLIAARQAFPPTVVTAYGTSSGSANQISGFQYFTIVNTGTSSLKLPAVNADTGALLGDRYIVANFSAASVAVYAAATPAGSAVTLYTPGASTSGTTGVSVGVGAMVEFIPVTVSTWFVAYGSA